MNEYEVVRGSIDGKEKYARIPIRSCIADTMQESGMQELSAEKILAMPHDQAVKTIDAIMQDWLYWLKRAGELFILNQGMKVDGEAESL